MFLSLNRELHPDGLPPSYTIIMLLRLLPDTPSEPFDVWQIADKNNNPEVGVTMNRKFPSASQKGKLCGWLSTCSAVQMY